MNCSAVLNRVNSPISQTIPNAVSVSMPRRQRNLATSPAHGSVRSGVIERPARLKAVDPPVDEIERVHVVTERLLLGSERQNR